MYFKINLQINKSELEKYYTGVNTVIAKSADGHKVQFPVNILQKFITHEGIHGVFILEYDDKFKFKHIQEVR